MGVGRYGVRVGRQRISRFGQGAARMLLVGFIAVEWMIAASSTWVYFAARHRVSEPILALLGEVTHPAAKQHQHPACPGAYVQKLGIGPFGKQG